jgi:chemotaxis protein methyltransferase CheR
MHGGDLSVELFAKYRELIYKVAGIQIPETKMVMVTNRLRRRLRATGIADFAAYFTFVTSMAGALELPQFIDEMTTNETYFYRDVHHFDWLSESFFPQIAEEGRSRKRPRSLRIWSAASSTGEELYSIALRFLPHRALFSGWTVTLLGTDLSRTALEAARLGVYDERAMRLVGPLERTRYFDHDPKALRWSVKEELRSLVTWKSHNLLRAINEEPFDCVFIKNVLIYFDAQSKQAATRHLIHSLAKGGYLVVGPTEGIYNMLEPLEKRQSWLYQRPAG